MTQHFTIRDGRLLPNAIPSTGDTLFMGKPGDKKRDTVCIGMKGNLPYECTGFTGNEFVIFADNHYQYTFQISVHEPRLHEPRYGTFLFIKKELLNKTAGRCSRPSSAK